MQVVTLGVLWKYHTLKNGEHTVKVRLTNYKRVEYIKTGLTSRPEDFDEVKGYPHPSHPKYAALFQKIKQIVDETDFQVKLAKRNNVSLTLQRLKELVEGEPVKVMPVLADQPPKAKRIFEFYQEIIDQLEKEGRIGYADVFAANKSIISGLFNDVDKPFVEFTKEDCKKIEDHIKTLPTESTKSLYLRTFYRVWNIAVKEKHCSAEHHPKNHISLQPYKRIKTKKRAIPEDYIHNIANLKFDYGSRLFRSQQYLIFCFYARGMNFTDFAKLKRDINIKGGYCRYKRSKNKRPYDFKLHPKAQQVVELFQTYPMQSDGGYIFPILDEIHDTPRKIDTRIESALKDFNEDLAEFEKMTDCPKHITSYVLRHAFATCLRRKKVDIAIIKEAMGHDTDSQTSIYLEETDDAIVAQEIEEALR